MTSPASTMTVCPQLRRVGLVGDFLRFEINGDRCTNFQPRNLAWLGQILAPAIRGAAPGLTFETVLAPDRLDLMHAACDNSDALQRYCDDALMAWAALYDAPRLDCFAPLLSRLLSYDLIVGFELPPVVRRHLHTHGKPYLNLFVHPLRFLRDLCFGASTNAEWIHRALMQCAVDDIEVQQQAHRHIGMFRRRQLPGLAIPAGLPVLIGQTERDSVLIHEGQFDTWASHADTLNGLLSDHDAVVFVEHPYRPHSTRTVQEIRSATGKTVISTNANGYGVLMSNDKIPFVATLASSLGVEAAAIGHETHFLLSDPRDKFMVDKVDLPAATPLGHAVLMSNFWRQVLGTKPVNAKFDTDVGMPFPLGDNYLRNSLDAWAYRGLQGDTPHAGVRKTFATGEGLTETRQGQLLAGLFDYAPSKGCTTTEALNRAQQSGVHVELLDAPLTIGETRTLALSSPSAQALLVSGFHPPEPWGCWTSELRSELLVSVAPEAVVSGCELDITMQLRLYDGLAEVCPVLKLSSADDVLGFIFFRPQSLRQHIRLIVPAHEPLTLLQLELSHIESPAARSESVDSRWLGVGLESLTMQCQPIQKSGVSEDPSAELLTWGLGRLLNPTST